MTREEYNKCVDLFSDNVYRFVLKNLRDEEKSKDIVQDTFEKLWVRIADVSYEKVKSYLFTAAYHTMIDLLRREKKQENFNSVIPDHFSHSEQYSDLSEILQQAVSRLPDSQRMVIMMRDYEGYSYKEIANITGLSEEQVKVYIFRGRVALKQYIGKIEAVI